MKKDVRFEVGFSTGENEALQKLKKVYGRTRKNLCENIIINWLKNEKPKN